MTTLDYSFFKMADRLCVFDLSHQPVGVCIHEVTNRSILIVKANGDPVTSSEQLDLLPKKSSICKSKLLIGDWVGVRTAG
jgi:hypothetical protein